MKDIRTGKMSTFGGPDDHGVSPSEGLALVNNQAQFNDLRAYFLDTQPPGTTGYARRLNPDTFYIACRWNYSETPPKYLRGITVTVTNPSNGKSAEAQPIDWGPNVSTGRIADLSPGLADHLGLDTDNQCKVEIPLSAADVQGDSHTLIATPTPLVDGLPAPSAFAAKLAGIAESEYKNYHGIDEGDSPLKERIKHYYATLNFHFESVEVPWSAAFISFCVHEAGASAQEFLFNLQHSQFVFKAIQNATNKTGVFRAYDFRTQSVRVGDILHNNQPGGTYDFDHAKHHTSYSSHSAIVISRGVDSTGKFAYVVGGNEGNSVGKHRITLNNDGTAKQRTKETFISIIKNLK